MVKDLKEVFAKFSDEGVCRQYLVDQRWNGKPVCPYCGCDKSYVIEGGKRFKCGNRECYKKYSVTVGTIFHASNIPLTTWFPAMYIITAHKKGISSVQLAKDLGVTQKTAWFMLHRIRQSLKETNPEMLSGIVESDETYMGKKFRSEFKGVISDEETDYHFKKKNTRTKGAVLGIVQRDTKKIELSVFPETNGKSIREVINKRVKPGSELHTDESFLYRTGLDNFTHKAVKHAKGNWVKDGVHTNTVENFWSVMKRGIYGIYHQVSYKHLQRYCDEFSYRFNSRDIKDGQRFELSFSNISRPLPYKLLVHGKSKEANSEA